MPSKFKTISLFSLCGSLLTMPSYGQATENAVTEADDAYGYTAGSESVGIYSQQSVRGFSLEAAGNYRVNGNYFVKSSGVSSFFLEGTSVRIGLNTFGLNFPGPSGVVDYRLREPKLGEPSLVTVGRNEYGGQFLDLHYKHRSADERLTVSAGLGLANNRGDHQGGKADSWLVAGTVRLKVGDTGQVQFFGGEYDYKRDGLFVVKTDGSFIPDRIERNRFLGQQDVIEEGQRRIVGLLWDQKLGQNWNLGANVVFSEDDPSKAVTHIFSVGPNSEMASPTLIIAPPQRFTAWSGEVRLGYELQAGAFDHKLNLVVRNRITRNKFGGDEVISLAPVVFGKGVENIGEFEATGTANLRNKVNQLGIGLAYHMAWRNRLRVSAGLMKNDYEKTFVSVAGANTNTTSPWIYNLGAAYRVSKRVELYATYSKGLEEAGTAPSSAANRNAVLSAVIAEQREVGLRFKVSPKLSLIVAGFDTRKPYAGLDAQTNIYALTGRVRHKGIEASLSGDLASGLSIVVGGVLTDAKLSGALVGTGGIASSPVAVPKYRAIAYVDYKLPHNPDFSIDLGLEIVGKQFASSKFIGGGQLELPTSKNVNLGLRYILPFAKKAMTVRVQVRNLFNEFHWNVNSAETFNYSGSRRINLMLTAAF